VTAARPKLKHRAMGSCPCELVLIAAATSGFEPDVERLPPRDQVHLGRRRCAHLGLRQAASLEGDGPEATPFTRSLDRRPKLPAAGGAPRPLRGRGGEQLLLPMFASVILDPAKEAGAEHVPWRRRWDGSDEGGGCRTRPGAADRSETPDPPWVWITTWRSAAKPEPRAELQSYYSRAEEGSEAALRPDTRAPSGSRGPASSAATPC
jgi:hypothetical protein